MVASERYVLIGIPVRVTSPNAEQSKTRKEMLMKRNLISLVIILCVSTVMFIACAGEKGPAEQAIKAAEEAINATKAEAVKYVPDQVKSLESALAAVKDKFAKGEYKAAISEAQSLVDKAKAVQAAKKAEGQARDFLAALGKFFSKKLPNGYRTQHSRAGRGEQTDLLHRGYKASRGRQNVVFL